MDQRVVLRDDCAGYMETFRHLENSRQYNPAGIQPITITEVNSILDLARVTHVDERLKLLRLMQAMDSVAMAHYSQRRSREIKTPEVPAA